MSQRKIISPPRLRVSASPIPSRSHAATPSTPGAARLTQIAFLLSLALVGCRLLMPEAIRSPIDTLAGSRQGQAVSSQEMVALSQSPQSPGPAGGLVLDLLFCLPALLILLRRALDEKYRLLFSWSFIPMTLLGVLAILSPRWSADKFASVVSASHLFGALIFIWSTCQLIRSWLRLRLIAGVCVGVLIALSTVGYSFRAFEFADLRQTWEQHKDQILVQNSITPGTFAAQMFEKRVHNGQPMGFSTSTNTYAALLVLLGIISAGVVIQHIADKDHWGWIVVPALAIAAVPPLIYWTGCRAAYVTPFIAALILGVTWIMRRWTRPRKTNHVFTPTEPSRPGAGLEIADRAPNTNPRIFHFWRIAYFLTLALIVAATNFLVRHGLHYGTLWHDSLNFRWRYWTGAFGILTDGLLHHAPRRVWGFLFGVGWENFGPYYLAHRLATASEEIRDPHNFIVRVFVELGIVGGVLLLAWMLRLWWEMTRPVAPKHPTTPHTACGNKTVFFTIAAIACMAMIVNTAEAIDFTADGAYVLVEIVRRCLFLVLLGIGIVTAGVRRENRASDSDTSAQNELQLDDRPAPWMLYAVLAALATFLIHNLIEFSLFEPGPLSLFALLVGSALGIRTEGYRETKTHRVLEKAPHKYVGRIGVALAGIAWACAAIFLAAPIIAAESLAHDADVDTIDSLKNRDRRAMSQAASEMTQAFADVPYNADYARRSAELSISAGADRSDGDHARKMLDAAIAADPSSVRNILSRAEMELATPAETDAGLADFRRALSLDPRNVRMRIDFARALLKAAKGLNRPPLAGDAAYEFDRALDDNDQLPPEEIKRLSSEEVAAVKADQAEAEKVARGRKTISEGAFRPSLALPEDRSLSPRPLICTQGEGGRAATINPSADPTLAG